MGSSGSQEYQQSQLALLKQLEPELFLMDRGGRMRLGSLQAHAAALSRDLFCLDEALIEGGPAAAEAELLRALQFSWGGRPTALQLSRSAVRWRLSLVPLCLAQPHTVDAILVLLCQGLEGATWAQRAQHKLQSLRAAPH